MVNAGLSNASPRSTIKMQELFQKRSQLVQPEEALRVVMPSTLTLGKVWLPLNRVTLSGAAGAVMRQRLFHTRRLGGLSDPAELFALDEITDALFHRLAGTGNVRDHVQTRNVDALIHGAMALERAKPKPIESVGHLQNTSLF